MTRSENIRPFAGVPVKCPSPSDVTSALSLQASANNLRAVAKSARERGDLTVAKCREIEAEEMDISAATFLVPDEPLGSPGIGGELVPTDEAMENAPAVFDTLKTSRDMVNATASRERLSLAAGAGALVLGALERMLAHQLAATHLMAMKFSEQATQHLRSHGLHSDGGRFAVGRGPDDGWNLQTLLEEASRAANTATRLMTAFQDGLLTLDRLRRGGKQTVKVVHVHQQVAVENGGQAVVTGTIKGREPRNAPKEFPRSTRVGGGLRGLSTGEGRNAK